MKVPSIKKFSYNGLVYNFAEMVAKNINCWGGFDLCNLHQYNYEGDNYDCIQRLFGENFHNGFDCIYSYFLKDVVAPIYFQKYLLYQTIPTLRISLPHNAEVAEWQRDVDYGHSKWEINYCVPLTKMFDNNAIWSESEPDKGDYQPLEADYGEFWEFYGAKCRHGNKVNDTESTSIAFSFRIMPKEFYRANDAKSIGSYWSEL